MNNGNSFYQLLGVKPGVSRVEIKRAYRRLVKSMHPDVGHLDKSLEQRSQATERMMRINEAYETLMDSSKRAAYDASLGLNRAPRNLVPGGQLADEDEARERYLRQVFHPYRQEISRILGLYQRQLRRLSLDIYDNELVCAFEHYVDRVEVALRRGAEAFSSEQGPQSLEAAIQMMRYSIAQAVDGLEEMRRFCRNYDYDHLVMAGNLFRIASDLSRQSVKLTRL